MISFPTQSCLSNTSFCDSLLHSLIMSQSPHNLHLQFCIINFRFFIISPYGIVLCCDKIFSFSFTAFFLGHAHIFSCEISLVCCLKYPYSYFSPHFCFLINIVLFVLMLSVLLLSFVISFSLFFFYIFLGSLYWFIQSLINIGESSGSFFSWHTWTLYIISQI